ncbi:MAG TPA: FKBP-type peptidyl-prolyl cis-trans isomerase [Bryobacteraceae bacterium]|nr:FKBP-type peptidyl-prolyl cis-trans isomerase [Bryobacteraceae bacterium]
MRLLAFLLPLVLISCSSRQAASPDSQAYLDKAAGEPGAVRTASGLVYRELRAGTGASPAANDTVKVHYRGTLVDGTEFDSSYKRNEPAQFPLNQVIPCWTEGVQKMKVGGKSRLVCPSSIAYGDRGSPPVIPGGATLIFEIELLGIGGA